MESTNNNSIKVIRKEIIKQEKQNPGNIYLHRRGGYWIAYEFSAFLLGRYITFAGSYETSLERYHVLENTNKQVELVTTRIPLASVHFQLSVTPPPDSFEDADAFPIGYVDDVRSDRDYFPLWKNLFECINKETKPVQSVAHEEEIRKHYVEEMLAVLARVDPDNTSLYPAQAALTELVTQYRRMAREIRDANITDFWEATASEFGLNFTDLLSGKIEANNTSNTNDNTNDNTCLCMDFQGRVMNWRSMPTTTEENPSNSSDAKGSDTKDIKDTATDIATSKDSPDSKA